MAKKIIFILGKPNTGKTTLAQKLVPSENRIHLDNVCMILGIKRPDLLPIGVSADDLPNIDFTNQINLFCVSLSNHGQLHLLVEEYLIVKKARMKQTLIVEGYAIGAQLNELKKVHEEEVIEVWLEGDNVFIDGTSYTYDSAVLKLKKSISLVKFF